MPWGCLQFAIVVFPDHTYYFMFFFTIKVHNWKKDYVRGMLIFQLFQSRCDMQVNTVLSIYSKTSVDYYHNLLMQSYMNLS